VTRVVSRFCNKTDSVISSSSRLASTPDEASALITSCVRLRELNCTGERLTATRMWRGHLAAWASAWRSAHSPMGTMRPVSSASGMNSLGGISVPCGVRQRISASKPDSWLRFRFMSGW